MTNYEGLGMDPNIHRSWGWDDETEFHQWYFIQTSSSTYDVEFVHTSWNWQID